MSQMTMWCKVYSDHNSDAEYKNELSVFYDSSETTEPKITLEILQKNNADTNEEISIWIDLTLHDVDHLINILKTSRKHFNL